MWYESATLPSELVGQDWTESPYESETKRLGGLVQAHRRSWRANNGRATARLMSINHPRIMKPDLDSLLSSLVNDVLWGQSLAPTSQGRVSMRVGGPYDATGFQVNLRIDTLDTASTFLGIPPPKTGPAGIIRIPPNLPITIPTQTSLNEPTSETIPDPTGIDLALLFLLWKTRCGPILHRCSNDHIYVGLTDNAHADAVLRQFPASITYA